jgi:hypothetical protein
MSDSVQIVYPSHVFLSTAGQLTNANIHRATKFTSEINIRRDHNPLCPVLFRIRHTGKTRIMRTRAIITSGLPSRWFIISPLSARSESPRRAFPSCLDAGGLQKDEAWRREWCDKVGLGFSVGLHGLQTVVEIDSQKAA